MASIIARCAPVRPLRPAMQHAASILQAQTGGSHEMQTRSAATLKQLSIRMRSIKNMQKITKAMKMVAAAKMKKDTRAMEQGLPFSSPVLELFNRLPRPEEAAGPLTYFAVTSDKGLCGGVNSAVAKRIRLGVADEEAKGNATKILVLGGKGIASMKRLYGDRFLGSFEEVSKLPFTFATASIMAERIVNLRPARLKVVSNTFRSMVAYDTKAANIITLHQAQTMDRGEYSKAMDVYSFEPSIYEVWEDLHEFYYGAVVFAAQLNSSTTETAQRMSAMENASKNAGEMYEKVSLQFNRARQAKITTELCEIISGASAV